MAYITIVSGGAQPVFATDVLNGNVAQTANLAAQTVTNFQGPTSYTHRLLERF